MSSVLALFLISQVFLIVTHPPLVQVLANIILNGNESVFELRDDIVSNPVDVISPTSPEEKEESDSPPTNLLPPRPSLLVSSSEEHCSSPDLLAGKADSLKLLIQDDGELSDLSKRPFLSSVFDSLETSENDYTALFSLCLLHALLKNKGKSIFLMCLNNCCRLPV